MNYDKTEMNAFVQSLYDAKMAEGKHGHYETMFHVVHKAIERAAPAALPVVELTYSLDADPQGIRARVVQAVLGALAFGAWNGNKPPKGHWLNEIWESARAEREDAVDRVVTLFESMETPYLPDIANAIDGAAARSQPVREPLSEAWILERCSQSWVFETAKQWVRMAEAAHGINGKP